MVAEDTRTHINEEGANHMNIKLCPVTRENWYDCIALQVHTSQNDFVASNLYSLAQAKVFPECVPLAIYAGDTMVGFTMYGCDPYDGKIWIHRFMIAQDQQGKGYGRAALRALIMLIEKQSAQNEIMLSVVLNNTTAERFYRSLGFQPTGEIHEGERVMRLRLPQR